MVSLVLEPARDQDQRRFKQQPTTPIDDDRG